MALMLYRHNRDAYEKACALMSACGRAAVIHPTGTGKSYIAFKLIEVHPEASFLWLSPSRYIMDIQCANLLREAPGFRLERVRFMTYAKLILLSDDEIRQLGCEYIVLDEFHRCGAEQWGQGVARVIEAYRDAKYLGLTATNIRYLDAGRDMAEELFCGNIASEMSLGEAIVRGILPVPEYITSIYKYNSELEDYQRRIDTSVPMGLKNKVQKQLESLRRTLGKAQKLDALFAGRMKDRGGKYIVFCASWEHLQAVRERIGEWFHLVDEEPHCYTLYSGESATGREFEEFCADDSDHLKLMLCINRLNEGIHIAGLSGVILFRPTVSPIIYKQQIGRALSAFNGSTPQIFDIVGNFNNLLSISSIQYEVASAVDSLRCGGRGSEIVVDSFDIDGQTLACVEMIQRLEMSINSSWDDYYEAAQEYHAAHGDLLMPSRYVTETGLQLGAWILTQRKLYRSPGQASLSPEQVEKLERIGMIWQGIHEYDWEKAFAEAEKYYREYGHLNVPSDFRTESGFLLGNWLKNQRKKADNNSRGRKLTTVQKSRLDSIGMVWEVRNNAWDAHYEEARAYYIEHGNLNIPSDYRTKDGFMLGMWLIYQRKSGSGRKASLTGRQIRCLEDIGMRWDSGHDQKWMSAYFEAKAYYEAHGDLNIPYSYKTSDGLALGRWLQKQRDAKVNSSHCNCVLNDERVRLLDEIGMCWESKNDRKWMAAYSAAQKYYEKHGDLDIPYSYKTDDGLALGKWLRKQRDTRNYESGMNVRRARLLEEIVSASCDDHDTENAGS